MIRRVYETDSRKSDFHDLVKKDMEYLKIDLTDEDIQVISKIQWKRYVHEKAKDTALEDLMEEKNEKIKTRHIVFDELVMSEYLVKNKTHFYPKLYLVCNLEHWT